MAWTSPMTAVANTVFTAAQYNTYVRDNLLETMPAKATAAGRWFVGNGSNSIIERTITQNTVLTSETTASTTYADLATAGPSVTATTSTRAIVFMSAQVNGAASTEAWISHEVSGASSVSASDTWAIYSNAGANDNRLSVVKFHTGITAGSNTFKMKYRVNPGTTTTFLRRTIIVAAM